MKAGTIALGAVLAAGLLAAGCSEAPSTTAGSVGAAQQSFKDCAECPEMVVAPAGEFTMGSPTSEMYRGAETQHQVTLPAFAHQQVRDHVR